MASMKELSRLMRELEDQLVVCMRCGMCQAACPLFSETGRESDVARGKLALLDGIMKEMFKNPDGVYERLNKCLLCGSCAANCPSGVDVLEIFFKARSIIVGFKGLPLIKKIILRGMLSRPKLFDRLMEWVPKFQKIISKPAHPILGTSCARITSPLLGHRHIKTLSSEPFHLSIPVVNKSPGRSGIQVAFFVGCLIDKIFPHVAQAATDVLNHHEVGVFVPESQGCCGIPAISAGDLKTFHRLIQYNLEVFNETEFDYLLTSCATCASTIKKIWPMMTRHESDEYKNRAQKIANQVMDINQFLVSKVGLDKCNQIQNADPIQVTYHDPCHLKKSLGIFNEPRALINANPAYMLKEMPEADRCCGLGGSFNLQYYEISASIGSLKRDQIKTTGCSVVSTSCPACMLQISDMLSQAEDQIAIKHPIEIYKELIKENESPIKTD